MLDNRVNQQEEIRHLKEEMIGQTYRHFKGNNYVVIDLAVHSESAEPLVIYKSAGDNDYTWARPLAMFLSPVDKDKYPDIKQELRFEKVCQYENI